MGLWKRIRRGLALLNQAIILAPIVLQFYSALERAETLGEPYTVRADAVPLLRRLLKPYKEIAEEI